jgi:hypothetical protein
VDDSDVRRRNVVVRTAATANDPPDAGRIGDRRGNQPDLLRFTGVRANGGGEGSTGYNKTEGSKP